MKSTILFLICLVFVASTSIETSDPILLELASDPRAEAVFATMSVQLEQDGGFDRVLALLNELVNDARAQIVKNNKIWKKTAARCSVSKSGLKERQDYYEATTLRLATRQENAAEERAQAVDTVQFRNNTHALYARLFAKESASHQHERSLLEHKLNSTSHAVEKVDAAIKSVQEWSPADHSNAAFIQAKMEEVAAAFLETHSYALVVPSNMVQLAAEDGKVKVRMLEWLQALKIAFLDLHGSLETTLATRVHLFAEIEKELKAGEVDLEASIRSLEDAVRVYGDVTKRLEESSKLFAQLIAKNVELIHANDAYCNNEKTNYEKVKSTLDSQIALFRQLRTYFKENYAKINKFVKRKYNNEA